MNGKEKMWDNPLDKVPTIVYILNRREIIMIKTQVTAEGKKSSGKVRKAKIAGQVSIRAKKIKRYLHGDANMVLDSKNRVTLGKEVIDKIKEITHAQEISSFNAHLTNEGDVVLKPMSTIPAKEMWLWKNKKALASVEKGLKEAKEGKGEKLDIGSL